MERRPAEFTEENFASLRDLLAKEDVTVFNKKMDIYEVANHFLAENNSKEPMCLFNLGDVVNQYNQWIYHLPNVKPFYAIKCNPEPLVAQVLSRLGCGFDCASAFEIKLAMDCGAAPEDIIFANSCKLPSMLEFAKDCKVEKMTFDSEFELEKIKTHCPEARLVLRIKTDDKDSEIPLSSKFGCHLDELPDLFQKAKDLGLNVVGVCFHVGSGCKNPSVFRKAIQDAKTVFSVGKTFGYDMNLLDIGGGFPGTYHKDLTFKMFADTINEAIENNFSDVSGLQVIAEPGRYFVTTCCSMLNRVIGKKAKHDKVTGETSMVYYISNGIYSGLVRIMLDYQKATTLNTLPLVRSEAQQFKSTIYGPTCASLDIICEGLMLPELEIEDHLIHLEAGSYGVHCYFTGQRTFNGFDKPLNKFYFN